MAKDFFTTDFGKFVNDLGDELLLTMTSEAISILSKTIGSSDAESFTIKMNSILDDDKKIVTPSNIESRIISTGENSFVLSMTAGEDRWFRADQLYGTNIVGQAGFKYTNIGG